MLVIFWKNWRIGFFFLLIVVIFKLNSIEKKIIVSIFLLVNDFIMFVGIIFINVFVNEWFCICFVVCVYFEIFVFVNCFIFMFFFGWKIFVINRLIIIVIVVMILK